MTTENEVPPLLEAADNTYATTEEAFAVIDYIVRYAKKRWPNEGGETCGQVYLWPEYCDVDFVDPTDAPNGFRTRVVAGSNTLWILVADHGYSDEKKRQLRLFFSERYTPVLQDCHLRAYAGLWRHIKANERVAILEELRKTGAVPDSLKAEVFADIANAARVRRDSRPPKSPSAGSESVDP